MKAEPLPGRDLPGFFASLQALRAEAEASLTYDDFRRLRRQVWLGRLCGVVATAFAWLAPNPLSALLYSFSRTTSWFLMHHITHRGYDRVPNVPTAYTSRRYGRTWRRVFEWIDWYPADVWAYAHNLHHAYTGDDERDPDVIERNLEPFVALRIPRWLKAIYLLGVLAPTWRATFYSPEITSHWTRRPGDAGARPGFWHELLLRAFLPKIALHFVALPLLFLPLGGWAVFSVLVNSLLGEALANLYTFFVLSPNHTAPDLFRFSGKPGAPGEHAARQVAATCNYQHGGWFHGFLHGWLNYQIEHHLWPDLPLSAYQRLAPKVRALCEAHEVPYVQAPLVQRSAMFVKLCLGDGAMRRAGEPNRR